MSNFKPLQQVNFKVIDNSKSALVDCTNDKQYSGVFIPVGFCEPRNGTQVRYDGVSFIDDVGECVSIILDNHLDSIIIMEQEKGA